MTPNINIKIFYHKEHNGIKEWYHVIINNTGYSGTLQHILAFIKENTEKLKEEN